MNDEEDVSNRVQTEGTALGTAETQRRSQYEGSAVPHASTMPVERNNAADAISRNTDTTTPNERQENSEESNITSGSTWVSE